MLADGSRAVEKLLALKHLAGLPGEASCWAWDGQEDWDLSVYLEGLRQGLMCGQQELVGSARKRPHRLSCPWGHLKNLDYLRQDCLLPQLPFFRYSLLLLYGIT